MGKCYSMRSNYQIGRFSPKVDDAGDRHELLPIHCKDVIISDAYPWHRFVSELLHLKGGAKWKGFCRKPKTLLAFSIACKQIKSWKKQLKIGRRRWWNARGRQWNESALREDEGRFVYFHSKNHLSTEASSRLKAFNFPPADRRPSEEERTFVCLEIPEPDPPQPESDTIMRAAGRLRVDSEIIENISSPRALEFCLQILSMKVEVKCARWFLMDAQWQSRKACRSELMNEGWF